VRGDIGDTNLVTKILAQHKPRAVINFAAESHVDRSIHGPEDFIQTNVVGTFHLLESVRAYWSDLDEKTKSEFRFLHVSTDEVYGTLGANDPAFTETTPYAPNSPYSASKASSDHLVRAYCHTYSLPVLIVHASNSYGPRQFPEKLIPLSIFNALSGKEIPIYGDGQQIRDWIFVGDLCRAITVLLDKGRSGESYNIGASNQMTNLDLVGFICDILDELKPRVDGLSYKSQIAFVKDRLGHDRRYAVDAGKIRKELGWKPAMDFAKGMSETVSWYINHHWLEH
jgi:dTDP-glucose 4,6-dehydratase